MIHVASRYPDIQAIEDLKDMRNRHIASVEDYVNVLVPQVISHVLDVFNMVVGIRY
jgi:hypothetical protein